MKHKKLKTKLVLKKETISRLAIQKMGTVKGGGPVSILPTCIIQCYQTVEIECFNTEDPYFCASISPC